MPPAVAAAIISTMPLLSSADGIYPDAAACGPDFDEACLFEQVRRSNAEPIPRPLSLDLQVPDIAANAAAAANYAERLLREIERFAPAFDRDRDVVALRLERPFRLLDMEQLRRIVGSLGRQFHFSSEPEREFRLQLGTPPGDTTVIHACSDLGFNRIGLAVDLTGGGRSAARGESRLASALAGIAACREAAVRSVALQLEFGEGEQDEAATPAALATVLEQRPERISLPGTARSRIAGTLLSALADAGYLPLGRNDFVLPDDDLGRALREECVAIDPTGYQARGECDVVGFGVGAVSRIGDGYCRNAPELRAWEAAIDAERLAVSSGIVLSRDDRIRAEVIRQLYTRRRIDVADISRRYGIDFDDYFAELRPRLRRACREGWLVPAHDGLQVAARDSNVLGIIALCFDRYAHLRPHPGAHGPV